MLEETVAASARSVPLVALHWNFDTERRLRPHGRCENLITGETESTNCRRSVAR